MLEQRIPLRHRGTADESAALLSECLAGKAEQYPDVEVEEVVEDGNPAVALWQWSTDARLVMVGSHGRGRAIATLGTRAGP